MESDGSQSLQVSGSHSFKVRGSVQFMPLKPGENGTFNNATIGNGGCSTFGRVWEGNTTHHGVTQTNNPGPGPSFFWTDGIRVASRFNIPYGTTGVLSSSTGEYEFQLWTLESEPRVIIKVTTSELREQAELAHHGVQKICNTKKREELDQDLQSQTGAHLQKTNLEVMYNHGNFSMTNGSKENTVEVKSLSETGGIYVWIHDGKLIVGGTTLTKEFREIFGIEQMKQQRMKGAERAKMVDDEMRKLQQYLSELYGGNR